MNAVSEHNLLDATGMIEPDTVKFLHLIALYSGARTLDIAEITVLAPSCGDQGRIGDPYPVALRLANLHVTSYVNMAEQAAEALDPVTVAKLHCALLLVSFWRQVLNWEITPQK
ncbi:hypothetical protein NE237_027983 [Protea cynaroides]|uniref:Uncharacterized protein n=1 Tax=Protea cynaroides TaxID=273540 RepID=A0A9Q0JTH8_9MAGN|nr:hypothetical protein NE237_027983 [Protea cynaroides]